MITEKDDRFYSINIVDWMMKNEGRNKADAAYLLVVIQRVLGFRGKMEGEGAFADRYFFELCGSLFVGAAE